MYLLLLLLLLLPSYSSSLTIHSLSSSSPPWLPTSNLTLLSPSSTFAAGFRPDPAASGLFLFSVWVQASASKTAVWSLPGQINSTSPLTISPSGVLSLLDRRGTAVLRAAIPGGGTANLTLEDSGSLVFGNWSSFGSPTDTLLPGQTIPAAGSTLRSGRYRLENATSLVYGDSDVYATLDAALANFTADGFLLKQGGKSQLLTTDFNTTRLRRLTLDADGNLRAYSLHRESGNWDVTWQAIQEICTIHGTCGEGYVCDPVSSSFATPTCRCPSGYVRKNTTQGSICVRRIEPVVQPKFLRMDFVDYRQPSGLAADHTPLNFDVCRSQCLANSSCAAFAYKFDGSRTCIHRPRPLVNGLWSPGTKTVTYLKVAGAEKQASNYTGMTEVYDTVCAVTIELELPPSERRDAAKNIGIVSGIFAVELMAGFWAFWTFLRRYSRYRNLARTFGMELMPVAGPRRFSYSELKEATSNFAKVLGKGAFGVVYKGELPDGRSVAVKKLFFRDEARGEAEFWAEVAIIARMHHFNLVRLWGFCAEKKEKMLVYEYVSNGSLSRSLFHPDDGCLLDWSIRYRIAVGVARAIAYLHEECSDWVLHRDIKPDNILLTHDFCPKVADFGLAKITSKEDKVKMSTVGGTRGYMAPEYWVRGSEAITAKADVYSFGMVLLDLVSGRRHWNFQMESVDSVDGYFPSWAYEKVFIDRRVEDIMDERIADDYDVGEHPGMVERMAKVAMWCIQDKPAERPSMGKVVKMLEGTVEITKPRRLTLAFGGEKGASTLEYVHGEVIEKEDKP